MIKYCTILMFSISSFLSGLCPHEHHRLNPQGVAQFLANNGMSSTKIQFYQNFQLDPTSITHIQKIPLHCGSVSYFAVLNSGEKVLCTHVSHGNLANQVIACVFNLHANPPFCPIPIPESNFNVLQNCCGVGNKS